MKRSSSDLSEKQRISLPQVTTLAIFRLKLTTAFVTGMAENDYICCLAEQPRISFCTVGTRFLDVLLRLSFAKKKLSE